MTLPATAIAANLAEVRERIAVVARAAGRAPESVTLVAVSKGHGTEAVQAALACGQRVFGENRVQEAEAKWTPLREIRTDLDLHLIGPLQTNKTADALQLFDTIETLDRARLVDRLHTDRDRLGTAARTRALFVQVNTGEEPQKAGVAPGAADAFIADARARLGLEIAGLMCIPPLDEEPAPHFALLAKIAARNGISGLSMGMSADYETAVAFGATHVRIGTAIFGAR